MTHDKIYTAIREAVFEAVERFGIAGVRKLSWFPSSRKNQQLTTDVEGLQQAIVRLYSDGFTGTVGAEPIVDPVSGVLSVRLTRNNDELQSKAVH